VTEDGLENLQTLPNLQSLNLASTQVTDDAMETFEAMSGLQVLNLRNTRTTETKINDLRRALPKCKISY
jgi:hypothetical protein